MTNADFVGVAVTNVTPWVPVPRRLFIPPASSIGGALVSSGALDAALGRGLNVRDILTSRLSARFSVVDAPEFDFLVVASCARDTESERERVRESDLAVLERTEDDR